MPAADESVLGAEENVRYPVGDDGLGCRCRCRVAVWATERCRGASVGEAVELSPGPASVNECQWPAGERENVWSCLQR